MLCKVCKKVTGFRVKRVLLRGHYNPTVKQKQHPNLQWVRVPVFRNENGMPVGIPGVPMLYKRIKACAKCIKASHKNPDYFIKKLALPK